MEKSENIEYKPMEYRYDYKKNYQLILDELDKEGFIYNASFYEEIDTYVIKKSSEIKENFSKLEENNKYYDKYEDFQIYSLNNDPEYIKIITHHMSGIQKAQPHVLENAPEGKHSS